MAILIKSKVIHIGPYLLKKANKVDSFSEKIANYRKEAARKAEEFRIKLHSLDRGEADDI